MIAPAQTENLVSLAHLDLGARDRAAEREMNGVILAPITRNRKSDLGILWATACNSPSRPQPLGGRDRLRGRARHG